MSDLPRIRHDDEGEVAALVALASLPGLSPKRLWALLEGGSASEAWSLVGQGRAPASGRSDDPAPGWPAHLARVDPAELLSRHEQAGVTVAPHGAPAYPLRLLDDPEPPAVVFLSGSGGPLDQIAIGVVGTRRCTRYGRDIATELGGELASRGIVVVSGLAHGIDASAHAGAFKVDPACCVAVVASGLDVVYPRGNRDLWRALSEGGCLLSEWPLGSPSVPWRFPARNRLIAALSVAVVVVESSERGGSMYTVDEALARDRSVFAVPGSIRSPASAGTNRLIADGAQPLTSIGAFADALTPPASASSGIESAIAAGGAVDTGTVGPGSWLLGLIGWEPMTIEQVVGQSGRPPGEVTLEVERAIRAGTLRRVGVRLERVR